MNLNRVAIVGASRVGKDSVVNIMIKELGYQRHSFGDLIKKQLGPIIKEHTGIDSFTENDQEKTLLRPVLEGWSVTNSSGLLREYWATAPNKLVNNRLVKLDEAREVKSHDGSIVWVNRPGRSPATDWERTELGKLTESGLVDAYIENDSTLEDLRRKVLSLFAK